MKVAVRIPPERDMEAVGILVRHSPGTVLPDRTYILESTAVERLREEGIEITVLSVTDETPRVQRELIGVRV